MTPSAAKDGNPGNEHPWGAAQGPETGPGQPWNGETLSLALRGAASVGAVGVLVHRLDPATGVLRLIKADGVPPERAQAWAHVHIEQDVPPARAARTGNFAWLGGDELQVGALGTAAVPLLGVDGVIGVLSALTAQPGEPDEVQWSFMSSVARWAAERLGTGAQTGLDVAASSRRTVRMGELTRALAEAVGSRDVVRAVAAHVLPPIGADGLIVWTLEGGRLFVRGSVGYPEDFLGIAHGLPLTAHAVPADILQSREALFLESTPEAVRRYPEAIEFLESSPKNAWAFLPMIASGRSIGVCVIAFQLPKSFSDEERTLLMALSGLVGQALERARLHDIEHTRAEQLQHALLPRALPRLPAAESAARYLSSGFGEQIGGDWYDLFGLSANRVAMVIGDVMGHGIPEATTMGRLRTAVRTLADLDMPPDELLARLNDLVSDLGDDWYATCLYAIFDPVTGVCSYSLAGHPPPVVVHSDGAVHGSDVIPDPPLGAADPPFSTHQIQMPDGSLFVLCTNGLLESTERDAYVGLGRLQQVLAEQVRGGILLGGKRQADRPQPLEYLCDQIVSALVAEHTTDDAALLITRVWRTAAGDVFTYELPDDARAAREARRHVREQLGFWGLDEPMPVTELLVSELVGNVIRHAGGPMHMRLLRSDSLTCEVYDGSLSTPRIRHASYTDEGGRGLQLVAALADRWGARYLEDGKCVWTEQNIVTSTATRPHRS
ncbi:SpoIIE family protein phosphatase [Streptomyces chartreusis]